MLKRLSFAARIISSLPRAIAALALIVSLPRFIGAQAQAPDTLWTKTFGGSLWDSGSSVQQTSDGGFIITGETRVEGSGDYDYDVWLIKTDASGDTLWTKRFGGTSWDTGESVRQTSDGGYIITGTFSPGANEGDVWLIKTDASGDTLWTKTFGGSGYDRGESVQQTSDGGYIIAGSTSSFGAGRSDVWLIKTDSSGNTLWTKRFGGGGWDVGKSVQQTSDGGYIITGQIESFGDVWLIKTDSSGNTLWTKRFGGGGWDVGKSVQQTSDGGYIITGRTDSFGAGGDEAWLIKTDSSGDTLWTKRFEGGGRAWGFSVQQTSDGGYIISGETQIYGAGEADALFINTSLLLIRTDSSGDTLWTKILARKGGGWNWGSSIQQTLDGGFIVTGVTYLFDGGSAQVWLVRIEPEVFSVGEVIVSPLYAAPGIDSVVITALLVGPEDLNLFAEIESPDGIPLDTLPLYNDGAHHDGEAGDMLFGNAWAIPPDEERIYFVDLHASYADTDTVTVSIELDNRGLFTTIGPVALDSYTILGDTIPNPGDNIFFKLFLRNNGSITTTSDILLKLSATDTCVKLLFQNDNTFGNILAGQSTATGINYGVGLSESCPNDHDIIIDISISSGGIHFWKDSFTIGVVTGISDESTNIPLDYSLSQNYPNPFNPLTLIGYALPVRSDVKLTIYNLRGQEVRRWDIQGQPAGNHRVSWDASSLASGVYIYRLQAGDFLQTKKMLLLK